MWRLIVVAAAIALFGVGAMPAAAQEGIYIENNGVDSSDSAAGADNVFISRDAGSSSMTAGAGSGNAERMAVREERKNRKSADEGSGEAAPVEAAPVDAVPAEGDYQAYTDAGYVDPAAPQAAAQLDPTTVLRLPSTGVGASMQMLPAVLTAGVASFMFFVLSLRRRSVDQ